MNTPLISDQRNRFINKFIKEILPDYISLFEGQGFTFEEEKHGPFCDDPDSFIVFKEVYITGWIRKKKCVIKIKFGLNLHIELFQELTCSVDYRTSKPLYLKGNINAATDLFQIAHDHDFVKVFLEGRGTRVQFHDILFHFETFDMIFEGKGQKHFYLPLKNKLGGLFYLKIKRKGNKLYPLWWFYRVYLMESKKDTVTGEVSFISTDFTELKISCKNNEKFIKFLDRLRKETAENSGRKTEVLEEIADEVKKIEVD